VIDVLGHLAEASVDAHTSIVLTYDLDPVLYDKLIRRRLAKAGAASQVVFCDANRYAAALDAVDATSRLGRTYSVTPVERGGAFHPKAYLLLGRRRGCLVVGSGNATIGGLVRNAEVFGRFDYDAEKEAEPHMAFGVVFRLVEQLADRSTPAVKRQIERALGMSSWLAAAPARTDPRIVHLGGMSASNLQQVIAARVGASPIRRIVVLSSSFDRKLDAVRGLANLGSGDHATVVVVQPAKLDIDGSSVRALPATVRFTEFSDPRPSKKKEPSDSYAHAKAYLIETTDRDYLFFGSANVSSPALISGANVELLVELDSASPGTWVERLKLHGSLERDIRGELSKAVWKKDPKPEPLQVQLLGVERTSTDRWLVVTQADVPFGVRLALAESLDAVETTLGLSIERAGLSVAHGAATDAARFAWLVDEAERRVSRPVAVIWSELAAARLGGPVGARMEQALLGLAMGDLLQPILFELLDELPDLDVLGFGRIPNADPKGETSGEDESASAQRNADSFYTDSTPRHGGGGGGVIDDQTDLEILAALIQPLSAVRKAPTGAATDGAEDDDAEDDADALAEEAERRQLDKASASTDGSERAPTTKVPTAARMRKAGHRLENRLARASNRLCVVATNIKGNMVLPPRSLARQVMMAYIGSAAAERPVDTCDEGEIVVVEARSLAHYFLRCAAALGRLATHVDPAGWAASEGASLLGGLRFLTAASAWAVAFFEADYEADEDALAEGVHDSAPLLVLARLLIVSSERVGPPDFGDAAQRMAAWSRVERGAPEAAYARAAKLAQWIATVERDPAKAAYGGPPAAGSLIHLNTFGVAVVLDTQGDKVSVAVPSKPANPMVFKLAKPRALISPWSDSLLIAPVEDAGWI
jgi:HKD family nuclease